MNLSFELMIASIILGGVVLLITTICAIIVVGISDKYHRTKRHNRTKQRHAENLANRLMKLDDENAAVNDTDNAIN